MTLGRPLIYLVLLTCIVSCGEDVGTNRKKAPLDRTTPGLETDTSIRSSIHRRNGATTISYKEEIELTRSGDLSQNYVAIPQMELDDEGTDGKNVNFLSSLGRPTSVCGETSGFDSVSERIADCAAKNGTKATWSGARNGAAGEGDWKLVYLNAAGIEIWQDTRTNMLWSDLMVVNSQTNFNWCQASGNSQGLIPETTIDCQTLQANINACQAVSISGTNDQINWRLPTRNDFLQADLDGARLVLKPETPTGLWTATMKAGSSGRTEAWVYHSKDGTLTSDTLTSSRRVRCIGTPKL